MGSPRRKPRHIVSRAETALRELELGCLTQADRNRCDLVNQGMTALDRAQAEFKTEIEEICEQTREALSKPYTAVQKVLLYETALTLIEDVLDRVEEEATRARGKLAAVPS
jgi:hypothetical protein